MCVWVGLGGFGGWVGLRFGLGWVCVRVWLGGGWVGGCVNKQLVPCFVSPLIAFACNIDFNPVPAFEGG